MGKTMRVEIDREFEPIVPRFLNNCRQRVGAMRESMQQNDLSNVRLIGHHLKGAGGGYGFHAITALGARIEEAAKAEDREAIARCIDELAEYLDSLEVVFV